MWRPFLNFEVFFGWRCIYAGKIVAEIRGRIYMRKFVSEIRRRIYAGKLVSEIRRRIYREKIFVRYFEKYL